MFYLVNVLIDVEFRAYKLYFGFNSISKVSASNKYDFNTIGPILGKKAYSRLVSLLKR